MGWKKVKLSEVLNQIRIPVRIKKDSNYNLVTVSSTGKVLLRKSEKGSSISAEKAFLAVKDKFIYSRLSIHNGAFGLVPPELDNALLTSEMPIFDINSNILPAFLIYSLNLPSFKSQLFNLTKGMGRTRVKENDFVSLYIDLPEINEQIPIIRKISHSEKVANQISGELNFQLEYLKKLRQQILRNAMHGKLVQQNRNDEPASKLLESIKAEKEHLINEKKIKKDKTKTGIKSEEIPYELPKNWIWCRFGELGKCRLGKMLDMNKNKGEYVKYIRNTNVQWKSIEMNNIKKLKLENHEIEEYKLVEGDLLICEGGVPGRCAIWKSKDEYYAFQKAIHRFRSNGSVLTKFVEYYLEYIYNNGFLQQYYTGNQIKHLTGQSLEKVLIPLSPLSEQYRIINKIEQLMKLCDELEHNIQQNQKYTQELLQVALKEEFEPKN